jgi:hypothetical protein
MCIYLLSGDVYYTPMGRIDVILPDEKEKKLRMEVGRRMGAKRGALTEAIIEAIDAWIQQKQNQKGENKQ